MKKILKLLLMMGIVFATAFSATAFAQKIDIKNPELNSIEISDSYIKKYTKNGWDMEFDSMVDGIAPQIELMAFDSTLKNQLQLHITETDFASLSNGAELTGDYNMAEDKQLLTDGYKSELLKGGNDNIEVQWFESEAMPTPYIMSTYSGPAGYVTEFVTIYNSHRISLHYIDTKAPDASRLDAYKKSCESIDYTATIDYTRAEVYAEEQKAKEQAAQNKDQQNIEESSDFVFWTVVVVVIIVLVLAIYMATRKRKKSVVKND